jgi:hypothetical protein
MDTAIEFEFEELVPVLNDRIVTGMMLYGTATLESADPSEPHAFYVSEVVLDGGLVLTPSGNVPKGHYSLTKELFKAVADIIQNDKHPIGKFAQAEFGSAVDEGEYDSRRYNSLRTMVYLDAGRPVRGASLDMEGAR